MVDKRELILLRILAVLASVDGIQAAYRDRGEFPSSKMPAIVLFDNMEQRQTITRGRHERPPAVVALKPQIYLIIVPRKDADNTGVGEELSAFRAKILGAIFADQELSGLLGENGGIEYLGCETDMQLGSSMLGQMQIDLSFEYLLDMNELM